MQILLFLLLAAGPLVADDSNVPPVVREKYPDLVTLIEQTESMSDEERDYWFQILPIMTDDQVKRLRDILLNEKRQLAKLDEEYQQELSKLNSKHLAQWEAVEKRNLAQEIASKEESGRGTASLPEFFGGDAPATRSAAQAEGALVEGARVCAEPWFDGSRWCGLVRYVDGDEVIVEVTDWKASPDHEGGPRPCSGNRRLDAFDATTRLIVPVDCVTPEAQ